MRRAALALLLLTALGCAAPAHAQQPPRLQAGVGKADITPRLGYYLGGWTRADRTAQGQHTRLHARALVLQRGDKKVALVAIDLFMVPGGMVKHLGDALASRGFSEQNILMSASHTHSGPGGYANFPTLNTAAPSLETATDPLSFVRFFEPQPADPQLYNFLLDQIAAAIVRADEDRAQAVAAWGHTELRTLTKNRSLEAHLNNHGIVKARGDGRPEDDPEGAVHTIDPNVDVLRVDKVIRGRRVPIGAWSTFADHGTVTKSTFEYYNGDHHASATRVFEHAVRRSAGVPRRQEVLNVYGNSDEGDMSAGLDRHGPAGSDEAGRIEAAAMLTAWRAAGARLSATPELDVRWTRVCFCGQEVDGKPTADQSTVGLPFLTGSEEERGPLYDQTGQDYEDTRGPDDGGPHGMKISVVETGLPDAVPLVAVRVGDGAIVSVPGEGTKEFGSRLRSAVGSAVAGSGVDRVVISGLANEFILYFTTPEEYDRQHYEGGNTHYGRLSSVLIQQEIAKLAGTLVRGEAPPPAYPFDPTNGVSPDGPPYGEGAENGAIVDQPGAQVGRLEHAGFAWRGGVDGLDRPLERAFVTAELRRGGRWVRMDDDLGLGMLWTVDSEGLHRLKWDVPLHIPRGVYRFVVTAKRYRLESREFRVVDSGAITVQEHPAARRRVAVRLAYPAARRDIDLLARPGHASGGRVVFRVGRRKVTVRSRDATVFTAPAPRGLPVSIEVGGARDRYGNANAAPIKLR